MGLKRAALTLFPIHSLQQLWHNGQLALKCQARMNLHPAPLMNPFGAFIWDSLVLKAAEEYSSSCSVVPLSPLQ